MTFRDLGIIIKIAAQGRFGRKLKGAGNSQHEALGMRIFQNVRTSVFFLNVPYVAIVPVSVQGVRGTFALPLIFISKIVNKALSICSINCLGNIHIIFIKYDLSNVII